MLGREGHVGERDAARKALAEKTIDMAAQRTLLEAGARWELVEGCAALFRRQVKLLLEKGGRVMVDEPGSVTDVDFAAAGWMQNVSRDFYRRVTSGPAADTPAKGSMTRELRAAFGRY